MAGSGLGTSGLPILRDGGGQQSRNVTSEWKGRWWHRAERRFFAPLTASPSSRQDGESGAVWWSKRSGVVVCCGSPAALRGQAGASPVAAASEWAEHRQQGSGVGCGLKEPGVGCFDGGEGLHGQFGAAAGDAQFLGPGVGGV